MTKLVDRLATEAHDALFDYAAALMAWNAPYVEHTRHLLTLMTQNVIAEASEAAAAMREAVVE